MTDPEDIRLTNQIALEQQIVIDTARKLQRGEIVGNEMQIPKVSTWTGPQDANFRYVVVVKQIDRVTGQRRETLHELFSDVPILSSDIRQMAANQSMQQIGNDTITGPSGLDRNWSEPRATIIAATQRM